MIHREHRFSDEEMDAAFRDLAAGSPKDAPPQIGATLRAAFEVHHASRRRRKHLLTGAGIAAACLAITVLGVWKTWHSDLRTGEFISDAKSPSVDTPSDSATLRSSHKSVAASVDKNETAIGNKNRVGGETYSSRVRRGFARWRSGPSVAGGFIPLPACDPEGLVDAFEIVRVRLKDSALSQLGLPVREEGVGRQILADLLVDRDGIPLAVRLVPR